jgi:hypothetical protein
MADTDDDVTEAHDQRMTVHILTHVPEHQPREDDPHYNLFNQAKARMKRQGLWKCAINDDYCGGNIELHHSHIEFSQVGSEDLNRVNEAFGLSLANDDAFQSWIESPGNLEALCEVHHRTHYGVHVLPGPLWEPLRYRKANAKPAAEFVTDAELAAATGKPGKETTTKTTKVTTKASPAGHTHTATDTKTETKLEVGHHTVDDKVATEHEEEKHKVPVKAAKATKAAAPAADHDHKVPEQRDKPGLLDRMFGRD